MAQAAPFDPCIQQGSHFEFQVQYTDVNDVPLDIAGATIEWQVRTNVKSAVKLLDLSVGSGITITDAANGIFTVEATAAETILLPSPSNAVHDLDIVRTQDSKRTTILAGSVSIVAEVTR